MTGIENFLHLVDKFFILLKNCIVIDIGNKKIEKTEISLFSLFLYPITLIIKLLTFLKPFLTKKNQCSIPIICIGNIYLGGTGKTPLSIEIYSILKKLNMNPFQMK